VRGHHLGQPDTEKAALRFEWNLFHTEESKVSNSVFDHGNGRGLYVDNSQGITLNNNLWYEFVGVGAQFVNVFNIEVTGNTIAGISARSWNNAETLDTQGAWILGDGSSNDPVDLKLSNNHAIGANYAGFVAPGSQCGTNAALDVVMVGGNTASSIQGDGWIGYRNFNHNEQRDCTQLSGFSAWKVSGAAVTSVANTQHIVINNSVALDTGKGLVANIFGQKGASLISEISNSFVYGESAVVRDCQTQNFCSSASASLQAKVCHAKFGTILPVHVEGVKSPLVSLTIDMPIESQRANSAFAGSTLYRNVHFEGFRGETYCGNDAHIALTLNPTASDITPMVKFDEVSFTDIDDKGLVYLNDPNPAWTSIRECGSFPCSGPNNVVLDFFRIDFNGERGTANEKTF